MTRENGTFDRGVFMAKLVRERSKPVCNIGTIGIRAADPYTPRPSDPAVGF